MTHSLKDAINLHRQKAEWEEMIPLAQEILSKDPGDIPALRSLAEAYDRTDQTEKTIEIWRILVDRHHEITPFARRLGLALKAKGDSAARTYLEQALTVAIDRKVMSEVEEIWLELMELPTLRPSFFLDYAARLAGRREKQRAGELLLIYVESASLEPTDRLACFRAVVDYLPDRQSEFREPLVEAFRAVYSNRPDLSKLIDLSNITFAESLPEAVIQLDRYLKFGEGQYFYHNGWGAGKIRRIDPGQQRVYIDFAKKKEHMLTLEMADKSLTPIPAGDLRAMWLEDEDKVRELARQNPVALVKSALISLGGKANAKELKDALLNCPISEVDWQKWWTAFNKKIKDDHFVEVTGASLKTYTLRDEPEGPDDEYARRFRECRTLRGRLDILGDYRGHLGDSCRPDLLNQMAHDLVSKASITKSDSEAAETVFVIHDLSSASSVKQEHLDQILFPILHSLD
ncbi:MAG: hypothetical protein HUU16_22405, partial [Candidatus Omnitrophica bacterium]|nr:hypothetical protein [Candidatus Omnitrophota bacterium]